jgi:hypothetical protein
MELQIVLKGQHINSLYITGAIVLLPPFNPSESLNFSNLECIILILSPLQHMCHKTCKLLMRKGLA